MSYRRPELRLINCFVSRPGQVSPQLSIRSRFLGLDYELRYPKPDTRRWASSSSKRWQARQGKDRFAINAKVQGLKSRAAFKLLEVRSALPRPYSYVHNASQINNKYKIFCGGQTVVDLVGARWLEKMGKTNFAGVCSRFLVSGRGFIPS